MKKILSLALIAVMLVLTVPAMGDDICEISVGSVQAIRGTYVEVPVSIENNPGIGGVMLELDFDSDILEPAGIETGAVFSRGTMTSNLQQDIDISTLKTVKVNWVCTSSITTDGVMFKVRFYVKAAPEEASPITINCGEYGLINQRYEAVERSLKDGSVYSIPYAVELSVSGTTVEATVKRVSATERNAILYISAVDSSGQLVYIDKQDVFLNGNSKVFTVELPQLTEPYTLRAMIWDDSMRPMAEMDTVEVR